MPNYTKGQTAHLLTPWNEGEGRWNLRRVTVASCGKKQLHLLDAETGETVGRRFPAHGGYDDEKVIWPLKVIPVAGQGVASEEAERLVEAARERKLAHYDRMLAREGNHPTYIAAVQADRDKLAEAALVIRDVTGYPTN